jgi:hypothetical protein
MVDMIFLELALALMIVATLAAAVATISTSRTVRSIAGKAVNGSLTAALVSVAMTAWFFFWPPL